MTFVVGIPESDVSAVPSKLLLCFQCGAGVLISEQTVLKVPNLVPMCPRCAIADSEARFVAPAFVLAEVNEVLGDGHGYRVPPSHEGMEQYLRNRYGK